MMIFLRVCRDAGGGKAEICQLFPIADVLPGLLLAAAEGQVAAPKPEDQAVKYKTRLKRPADDRRDQK